MATESLELFSPPTGTAAERGSPRRRNRMADILLQQAADTSQPVPSHLAGLAKAFQGGIGGWMAAMDDRRARDEATGRAQRWNDFLVLQEPEAGAAGAPAGPAAPAADGTPQPPGAGGAAMPVDRRSAGIRPAVPASPTVWGDDEAVAAGLYDPPGGSVAPPPSPAAAVEAGRQHLAPDRRAMAAAILADENTPPAIKAALLERLTPQKNQITVTPDGTILAVDPRGNRVTPIYQTAPKPVLVPHGAILADPVTGRPIVHGRPRPSVWDRWPDQ